MKISLDELSATVELELDNYAEEIRTGLGKEVKAVASKCVKRLRETSPRKTGKYAKGWTMKMGKNPRSPSATIYNKSKPWLGHLLEDGHQKKTGGRVEGVPHIRPAAEEADRELEKAALRLIRRGS